MHHLDMARTRPQLTAEQHHDIGRLASILDTVEVLTRSRDNLVMRLLDSGISQRHLVDALGTSLDPDRAGAPRLSQKSLRTLVEREGQR